MPENPYSPTSETDQDSVERPMLHVLGFWVSAIFAFLTAAYVVVTGYVNFTSGSPVPTYILAVTVFLSSCAVEFAYSAYQWRKGQAAGGIVIFAFALASCLIVPPLLLRLLA